MKNKLRFYFFSVCIAFASCTATHNSKVNIRFENGEGDPATVSAFKIEDSEVDKFNKIINNAWFNSNASRYVTYDKFFQMLSTSQERIVLKSTKGHATGYLSKGKWVIVVMADVDKYSTAKIISVAPAGGDYIITK